jgi:proteasome accessory factor C
VSAAFTAQDRLARLLAVIPWVAARPDGATLAEIEQRFDYPARQVRKDLLEVVFFVGIPPYTPGDLIDVLLEDERVTIGYKDWFARPMRLSAADRLRLVTAARAMLSFDPVYAADDATEAGPGGGSSGSTPETPPLVRGLAKLTAAAGRADGVLEVHLGDVPARVRAAVEASLQQGRLLELDYYSYGRDTRSVRVVEPRRLANDDGEWYLTAWCRRADAERVFRVDRILRASVLDEPSPPATGPAGEPGFRPPDDAPRVDLELAPGAGWVLEQYPNEGIGAAADGWTRVTLAVAGTPWLERLLLRLGPLARLAGPAGPGDGVAPAAAARVLARYR